MSFNETLKLISDLSIQYMIDKPYIVGGLPRDIYLKIKDIKTTDIDITTNSFDVLRLGLLVADKLNVTMEISEDGHVTVFSDQYDIDFSSHFISDKVIEYLNGKHKGLEEVFSRDFTINTLHQDLITREILDLTGKGFSDIKNKVIDTPVPAEITLTDDPRRVYRAVDLAVRYDFEISEQIKKFVLENEHLFTMDKIKDKYIATKVNKALKNNSAKTIKLLKELNLFKNIPLKGYFKEFLISNKMLSDYLGSQPTRKQAAMLPHAASSWEEYSSQGPEYKAIEDWWKTNYRKLSSSDSYDAWTSWYMSKYNSEWGGVHKSPEDTLKIMSGQEVSSPTKEYFGDFINTDVSKRINKIKSLFHKDRDSSKKDIKTSYKLLDMDGVYIKPGVNVENVTPEVKMFISELGSVAEELGLPKPIITSGWRSIRSQARIMRSNWKDNGGMLSGRKYLTDLYGKQYGGAMADIFERYPDEKAIELGMEVIKSRPIGSNHISDPGKALDLGMTNGIKKILDTIKQRNKFNMKIVDETKSHGAHYHVSIVS